MSLIEKGGTQGTEDCLPSALVLAEIDRIMAEQEMSTVAFGELLCERFPDLYGSPSTGARTLFRMREQRHVTVALADRLLVALGAHLLDIPAYRAEEFGEQAETVCSLVGARAPEHEVAPPPAPKLPELEDVELLVLDMHADGCRVGEMAEAAGLPAEQVPLVLARARRRVSEGAPWHPETLAA